MESDNVTINTNQPMTTLIMTNNGYLFVGGLDFLIFVFRDEPQKSMSLEKQIQTTGYLRCGVQVNDLVYLGIMDQSILVYNIKYQDLQKTYKMLANPMKMIIDQTYLIVAFQNA